MCISAREFLLTELPMITRLTLLSKSSRPVNSLLNVLPRKAELESQGRVGRNEKCRSDSAEGTYPYYPSTVHILLDLFPASLIKHAESRRHSPSQILGVLRRGSVRPFCGCISVSCPFKLIARAMLRIYNSIRRATSLCWLLATIWRLE